MAEWFVFSDTAYYPSVVNEWNFGTGRYDPIVAGTPEEAAGTVSDRESCYVVPYDAVTRIDGPEREEDGRSLVELQDEANRARAAHQRFTITAAVKSRFT